MIELLANRQKDAAAVAANSPNR